MLGNKISNKDYFIPNQNLKLQAKQHKIVQMRAKTVWPMKNC